MPPITALQIKHFRCFASGSICLVQHDLYSHVHTTLFNTRRRALSLFTWRPIRSPSAPILRNKCPWAHLRHTQIGTKQGPGIQWVLATDGPNVNWPGASTVLLDWVLQAIKVKPFSHMVAYISAQCLHSAHFYSNIKVCCITKRHNPGLGFGSIAFLLG